MKKMLFKKYRRIKSLNKLLYTFLKGNIQTSETLKTENEELKKKNDETTSKVLQLEEDLVSVTQKAIEKETELDRYLTL